MASTCALLSLCCFLLLFNYSCGYVAEKDLFPFGPANGDSVVPPADDTFAGPVPLKWPFPFFNQTYTSLYVENNGAVSFADGIRQFSPTCGALPAQMSMIAPFWADIHDAQGFGGQVYYRESTDQTLRSKVNHEIQRAFPDLWGNQVDSLFITTWYKSPFFGASGCGYTDDSNTMTISYNGTVHGYTNDTVPRNTFQLIMATDSIHSFAIMCYSEITWTTGTASNGNCSGLGGIPAKAGFDYGDGKTFFEIPGSCKPDILNIGETSNVGQPGKWIFRIDDSAISAGCDNELYKDQKLNLMPSFTTLLGHTAIAITGPCFNESYTGTCAFQDGDTPRKVEAATGLIDGIPTAVCLVPFLYTQGRLNVQLKLHFGDHEEVYEGFIYVNGWQGTLDLDYTIVDDKTITFNLTWDKSTLPENVSLELVRFDFDKTSNAWIESEIYSSDVQNTGNLVLTHEVPDVDTFSTLSLRVPEQRRTKRSIQDWLLDRLVMYVFPETIPFIYAIKVVEAVSGLKCGEWLEKDPGITNGVLHCPPTLDLAQQDFRYEMIKNGSLEKLATVITTGKEWPGFGQADFRYIQRVPEPATGAAQTCATRMVSYWIQRCWVVLLYREEWCQMYHDKRPSDSGADYQPPFPSRATGDPHMTTFDGASYTFNGAGEFWMIKGRTTSDFQMQARMEQYVQASGTATDATVFIAFTMAEANTRVQAQLSGVQGIDVLLSGDIVDFGSDTSSVKSLVTEVAAISVSSDRNRVNISFSSGFSFTISRTENALDLWSTADTKNKGKTRGLLGVFDDDPSNDLQAPDGTIVPINSSLQTIHYEFGLTWMVTKEESLFTYGKDRNYDTYRNDQFAPSFAVVDPESMPEEIVDMCDSDRDCLYDYATTGNAAIANQTATMAKKYNETINTNSQNISMCDPIKSPDHGYMNVTNFFVGAIVKFGCFDGYHMNGTVEIQCNEGEMWDGGVPICDPDDITTTAGQTTAATTSQQGSSSGCIAQVAFVVLLPVFAVLTECVLASSISC